MKLLLLNEEEKFYEEILPFTDILKAFVKMCSTQAAGFCTEYALTPEGRLMLMLNLNTFLLF